MNLVLERFCYGPLGTFGRLVGVEFSCFTVEEVWANNAKGKSCIPIGTYTLKRDRFPKHGEAFEVCNVPNRTAILIHVANTIDDIEGCIGPGEALGFVDQKWAVVQSAKAYQRFMEHMRGTDEATFSIVNLQGGI